MRVKVIGTRTEVGEMWAIGSIKEDYLGYVDICEAMIGSHLQIRAKAASRTKRHPRWERARRRATNDHAQRDLYRLWSARGGYSTFYASGFLVVYGNKCCYRAEQSFWTRPRRKYPESSSGHKRDIATLTNLHPGSQR